MADNNAIEVPGKHKLISMESAVESGDKKEESGSIHLPILQEIREAQQQHGLRHGDYQRYRGYCSRRLRRLRKSLHFTQGTRNKFQQKKVTEDNMSEARFLLIPLMSAERAWSYAMQLKTEANSELRKRFHMASRFRKAEHHAAELRKLGESDRCDARTKLEAEGYYAWMLGTLNFETQSWHSAIKELSNAKTIYSRLGETLPEDLRPPYTQRVEELEPSLRYCAYNMGDASAADDLQNMRIRSGGDSQIDELLSQTREKQASTLSEVTWRGRTMPVLREAVRVFLLSLQESEREIAEADSLDTKISIYETLLKDCMEAIVVQRDDLKSDQSFKAAQRGQKTEGRVSNQHLLHTYLCYLRHTTTVERSLAMAQAYRAALKGGSSADENRKQPKPQDLVRLYDIVIQNLGEVQQLAGLDDDQALADVIDTYTSAFRVYRCLYIATYYSVARKWAECMALCERTQQHCNTTRQRLDPTALAAAPFNFTVSEAELQEVGREADALKYSARASSLVDVSDLTEKFSSASLDKKKPLVDRLEQYWEDPGLQGKHPNLVTLPPAFEPVPCKPLFFDLASNHLQFPSLESKVAQQPGKRAGITGLVKGWLWGGKK